MLCRKLETEKHTTLMFPSGVFVSHTLGAGQNNPMPETMVGKGQRGREEVSGSMPPGSEDREEFSMLERNGNPLMRQVGRSSNWEN